MENIDILNIDAKIRQNFTDEINRLPEHREKLVQLEKSLNNSELKSRVRESINSARESLLRHIEDLENQSSLNFYLLETVNLIEEYKQILKTPVKVNFMGKPTRSSRQKRSLIHRYLEIAQKYIDIDRLSSETNNRKIKCRNCGNKKDFEIEHDNVYICTECFTTQRVVKHNSSYNDVDRVNISNKYTYDPKIHFRDCIKQYQGKQNCTIPAKVYNDLEEQFALHHLLVGDRDTPKEIRFQHITKNHIMMFLKELNYPKHYENVHLIHYNITGVKPDDISHLEEQLLDDFDVLIELYYKRFKHIKRKNFINTQYVLYQLLFNHRHPCNKEEFIILKTNDRKCFHDEICKTLFEELGWNHNPCY